MSPILIILISVIALAAGGAVGYELRRRRAKNLTDSAESRAEKKLAEIKQKEQELLLEAKNKEQEILLEAKEKAIKVIDEAKKEADERRQELKAREERLTTREDEASKTKNEYEEKKQKIEQKVQEVEEIKSRILKTNDEVVNKLESVSQYTKDQAKEELFSKVEKEVSEDMMHRVLKFEKAHSETLEAKAQDIMVCCMQRTAANHATETTSTAVQLQSDELKGRIIGKEGRNIKTIEKLTGCELIIDETPDMILISSFSPIRRRVCQIALEKLIKDGRIQPAKIEEFVEEAKKELAVDIRRSGEEALHEMGIINHDPKFASIVGRLKYRTSYGQNVLNHCKEVGYLSALMAQEVGLSPALAKKAGFFHDIGKAMDHETQGAHTEIGFTILKKFNFEEEVAQVALTHHDTNPPLLLTKLVMAGDAISASRVGARRDSYEQYVARLEELEKLALDFKGVEKAYAIQAGREVRVFINPHEIDDYKAYMLAKDIARGIEGKLRYPGEIKVIVVRETRAIEYAR